MTMNDKTATVVLQLKKQLKVKHAKVNQLTEEMGEQKNLINHLLEVNQRNLKNCPEYQKLVRKNETLSIKLSKHRVERGRIENQKKTIKSLTAVINQLREQNAVLVAGMKENRGGGGDQSCEEPNQEIAKVVKNVQTKGVRRNLRAEISAAAKSQVDNIQQHQVAEPVVTQGKETGNPEVNVGSKEVAKEGVVAQESVVSNMSDSNLRKKCFEDEEIVDEVDDDIEKLIMETYTKKVSFEDDVQEQVVGEEESEEGGAAEEVVATADNPLPTNEMEEGAEGPIVGEIGQFRKRTFDDEEVIDEVDPEVEAVISGTYSTVSVEEEESSA